MLITSPGELGSIPCVAAAGVLGLAIARVMERRGASRAACIATVVFSMVNPLTREALALGHPEELLGGALCVGAVLAALRGRRLNVVVVAGAVAAVLTVPLVVGSLSGFSETAKPAALMFALALPLSAAWWFSRRRTPDDVLALLALLFLLGCLLDPVDNAYYHVPFLLSLIAWEGLVRRGLPVVSILSSVTIYYAIQKAGWIDAPALRNALYLAATLPVALYLAARLYMPRRTARPGIAGPPLGMPAPAGPAR